MNTFQYIYFRIQVKKMEISETIPFKSVNNRQIPILKEHCLEEQICPNDLSKKSNQRKCNEMNQRKQNKIQSIEEKLRQSSRNSKSSSKHSKHSKLSKNAIKKDKSMKQQWKSDRNYKQRCKIQEAFFDDMHQRQNIRLSCNQPTNSNNKNNQIFHLRSSTRSVRKQKHQSTEIIINTLKCSQGSLSKNKNSDQIKKIMPNQQKKQSTLINVQYRKQKYTFLVNADFNTAIKQILNQIFNENDQFHLLKMPIQKLDNSFQQFQVFVQIGDPQNIWQRTYRHKIQIQRQTLGRLKQICQNNKICLIIQGQGDQQETQIQISSENIIDKKSQELSKALQQENQMNGSFVNIDIESDEQIKMEDDLQQWKQKIKPKGGKLLQGIIEQDNLDDQ